MRPHAQASKLERTLLELAAVEKDDFDAALRRILPADADLVDVERVNFWSLHAAPPEIRCELGFVRSLGAFDRGIALPASTFPEYFRALEEQQVIDAGDARGDPRTRQLASYLEALGISALLDIPVWSRGILVGVLCHEHVGPARRWSADEIEMAIAFAQLVATAVEARERRRAEGEARRATFLAEASERLSRLLELEELPRVVVRLLVPRLADWCVLDGVSAEGKIEMLATEHRDPARAGVLAELAGALGAAEHASALLLEVLQTKRSLLVPRVDEATLRLFGVEAAEQRALVERLGARSALVAPLVTRDTAIGVLLLVSATRGYDHEDLDLVDVMARRAAVHLDNARLYREARGAVQQRDEFLAVASHELRTPLTALGLAADALRRGVLAADQTAVERAAEIVSRQHRRLTRLIDELLDVARAQERRLAVSFEETDLAALVREVAASFGPELKKAGAALELKAPEHAFGSCDRSRMEQVLANLLSNAAKFGRGRPVEVELAASDESATLTVRDHGIGVPEPKRPLIFDRFARAVSSREYGGLGLGLYIARAIVEAHGGSIRCEETRGGGATFVVEWPLLPPPLVRGQGPEA